MKTVCLYTRKHPDGGRQEKYLDPTNTNRARTFATIDGEIWTNRGLITRDVDTSTAEHENRLTYADGQPVYLGDSFDNLGQPTFGESDLVSRREPTRLRFGFELPVIY